jgi:hypothetical protein
MLDISMLKCELSFFSTLNMYLYKSNERYSDKTVEKY